MSHVLPAALRSAITSLIQGVALTDLARRSDAISGNYRAGGGSGATIRDMRDAAAYTLARLPATYAAAREALSRLEQRHPGFAPESVLDVGCGPGSAMLAALDAYPGLSRLEGLDGNPHFLATATALLDVSGMAGNRQVRMAKADFRNGLTGLSADLVMMSYALVELPPEQARKTVLTLFEATGNTLLLVEPGSTAGFERIRMARTALIAAGATIIAPCTHAGACGITAPDWCHFSVRLARSREHQRAKSAHAPFEDEKFSYLVATRPAMEMQAGERIIAPPHAAKGETAFRTCGPAGIGIATVQRRESRFKAVRKADWGDILP